MWPKIFFLELLFFKKTEITVKENNTYLKKKISEIKKDDLIMTLVNGERIFTKVKYAKEYNDEFIFINSNAWKIINLNQLQ